MGWGAVRLRDTHTGKPAGRLALGRRGVASFRLPEQITQAVSELARAGHTTVSTVLQAAFAQVLMWLTGQRDVAFGTTVSGRPAEVPGADSMVGLFINTVPVRARMTSAITTAHLLGELHSAHNDVLEHQHLALSEIHRVAGQDHLFDTFFVYENYPLDAAALSGTDGLAVTEFIHREYNHYPLAVQAMPDTELRLRIEFDTDVFDSADVETLVGRFERVLVAMTADPQRRLSSVDVLSEAEHARLDEWGNRAALARSGGAPVTIPAAFGAQAIRTPDAAAVTFEGVSITYRELDEYANRLAHLLVGHTVPDLSSRWLWGDPGHRRSISRETLTFLDQSEYARQPEFMTDYRSLYKADFRLAMARTEGDMFAFVLEARK